MNMLQRGDTVCIIAPSRSMGIISDEVRNIAVNHLQQLGLHVVFSRHAGEIDEYGSSSIASRIEDIHAAFADSSVKGILTVIGGFNVNQLINKLDYGLIQKNPKILCGFSDITALLNAIYTKTGLITYYGPHFSSFGMKKGLEYTISQFEKCFFSSQPYRVYPPDSWSDDAWFIDQQKRIFMPHDGYIVINEGSAEGTLVGGNLCTFNLLQGTPYMPPLDGCIVMMEEADSVHELSFAEFDRNLQSLIECTGFSSVKGIIIGRFQKASAMNGEKIKNIIKAKTEIAHIPVIADVAFGHTTPITSLPIGGMMRMEAHKNTGCITVLQH